MEALLSAVLVLEDLSETETLLLQEDRLSDLVILEVEKANLHFQPFSEEEEMIKDLVVLACQEMSSLLSNKDEILL